jgi:CubicO group peptidase (beta-lactamase class C family)
MLTRLVMFDSVPGPNIINVVPPEEGVPSRNEVARYRSALDRRALPYAVDSRGRVFASTYPAGAAVLTPSTGLVTTVRDLAKFDLALRQGDLRISRDTLEEAWSAPAGATGRALPHGLGWFVQRYKGEKVVWQFGVGEDASSSLMITLPERGLTLIMMANSDRLVKPYSLDDGDVSLSPFARLFLSVFVR